MSAAIYGPKERSRLAILADRAGMEPVMTETTETVLQVGDRVRAVQCGEDKRPREGGKILLGTVTAAEGAYYSVAYDDPSVYTGRHDPYWKGTLWRAWCWGYWKLEPVTPGEA